MAISAYAITQYFLILIARVAVLFPQIVEAQSGVYKPQQICGFVDYVLAAQSFNVSVVKAQKHCFKLCLQHPDCKSTNYFLNGSLCALNNVSHLNCTQELKMEPGSFYTFKEAKGLQSDCSLPATTDVTSCSTDNIPIDRARSCKTLFDVNCRSNGVYTIYPGGLNNDSLQVFCDMETDGGGYIVFQRRQDGSVDFYRNWVEYQSGFGDLSGEFWLGNDNLVALTSHGKWELRIDMEDWEGNTSWVKYDDFSISHDTYDLQIGQYDASSTGGDSFEPHNGESFTTKDKDIDTKSSVNCADERHGAWWFYNCGRTHLNGRYYPDKNPLSDRGITWRTFKGDSYSLKKCSMKMRESIWGN